MLEDVDGGVRREDQQQKRAHWRSSRENVCRQIKVRGV